MSGVDPRAVPKARLRSGAEIPRVGLGTFGSDHVSHQAVGEMVYGALKAGYRLLDCASVYGNEPQVGQALKRAVDEGVAAREDVFVCSKVWNDMHGDGDVLLALAGSLKSLGLAYLDAYYVHWPFPNAHLPGCDGDSRNPDSKPFSVDGFMGVWRQMERLYDLGLVKHLGMSNMTVKKLAAVLPLCRVKPELMEMELHPAFQQKALFDACVNAGIVPVGFCPIGSPMRPERDKAAGDVSPTQMPEILEIARAHGAHPADICVKWSAQRGAVPIPFSEHHFEANLRAVSQDPLTEAEMARIAAADRNCRIIKGQVFLWPGAKDWRDLWDEDETLDG